MSAALAGDEIRVAEGTYRPDESTANPGGTNHRGATFQLISGVTVAGGYAGYSAADSDERGFGSVLSGDIAVEDDDSDNSHHVVTGGGTDATAVLDAFTITGGNANGGTARFGGGMSNRAGNPTLTNCTFSRNSASAGGGGMYNNYTSTPTLANCLFIGNSTTGWGGGIYNWGSSPTLTNCTFSGNSAGSGGGMGNYAFGSPTLTNCIFRGNSAASGGGMYNCVEGNPTLTNCTFSGNSAGYDDGGGMYNYYSSPTLTNCTFSGNSASNGSGGAMVSYIESVPMLVNRTFCGNSAGSRGGAIASGFDSLLRLTNCTFTGNWAGLDGGGLHNQESSATLVNCILWRDTPNEIHGGAGQAVLYTCVQGGHDGAGNIDGDPLFVDPDGPDDVLGTPDDDLRLLSGSPCIDAGLSVAVATDLDGNRRIVDDPAAWDTGVGYPEAIDMGAYEYGSTPAAPLWPDLDGDCDVDLSDLIELLAHYGETCD